MKKYVCTVPLEYSKQSLEDTYDQQNDYFLQIDERVLNTNSIEIKVSNSLFESKETCIVSIYTKESNLFLKICSLYADTEQYAVEMLEEILQSILPALSYTINLQNSNKHLFQFKLMYNIRNLSIQVLPYEKYDDFKRQSIREERGNEVILRVIDRFQIKEHVNIGLSQTLTLEKYQFVNIALSDPFIKQLLESYVRALGDTDYRSKYFNLFIIIEALEGFYKEDIGKLLLTEQQVGNLMKHIENWELLRENETIHSKVKGRIESTLRSITTESRNKKLQRILNERLGIKKVQISETERLINLPFIKAIVKQRNSLFHAKDLNPNDYIQLKTLVFDLIVLCEKIIFILIERANKNR